MHTLIAGMARLGWIFLWFWNPEVCPWCGGNRIQAYDWRPNLVYRGQSKFMVWVCHSCPR